MEKKTMHLQSKLLKLCLNQIEATLSWPPSSEWRHSHFEQLSERIQQKTNVLLSVTTLKRIWGKVNYQSSPSASTLDTLAQHIGYKDWMAFQNQSTIHLGEIPNELKKEKIPIHRRWLVPMAVGFVLTIACISFFSLRQGLEKFPTENVHFDFKPISSGIPNTVSFNYAVKVLQADSFFIQQSWDRRLRHQIDPMNNFHAVTYYYPGLFKAKLIANESIVLEKDLLIPSEGWLGVIRKKPVPYYLRNEEIVKAGKLAIEPNDMLTRGFNLHQEVPITNLYLVGEFEEVAANDFKLITRFKNLRTGNDDICQHTQVVLYTTAGAIVIPFAIKGCASELTLILPHKYLNGQGHDLSDFGVDFNDWVHLEVGFSKLELSIHVNDQKVYQEMLSMDYGQLAGFKYTFYGGGAVQSLELESEGKMVYQSDFHSLVHTLEPN